jgi:hypothetical protein
VCGIRKNEFWYDYVYTFIDVVIDIIYDMEKFDNSDFLLPLEKKFEVIPNDDFVFNYTYYYRASVENDFYQLVTLSFKSQYNSANEKILGILVKCENKTTHPFLAEYISPVELSHFLELSEFKAFFEQFNLFYTQLLQRNPEVKNPFLKPIKKPI